jgi:hypothetical protein
MGLDLHHKSSLACAFSSKHSFALGEASLGAETHDTTTPLLEDFIVVVELLAAHVSKLGKRGLVFLLDSGDGEASGVLLVNKSSKTGLVLDDAEGHAHLAAEGRKPDDDFDRVDVVGDHNKLSLLLFDEGGHVVQTKLDHGSGLGGSVVASSLK